jgi:hypothetical protein
MCIKGNSWKRAHVQAGRSRSRTRAVGSERAVGGRNVQKENRFFPPHFHSTPFVPPPHEARAHVSLEAFMAGPTHTPDH